MFGNSYTSNLSDFFWEWVEGREDGGNLGFFTLHSPIVCAMPLQSDNCSFAVFA